MATNKIVTVTVLPTRTGDSVASYNVYSSIDGLLDNMSPAEAISGAFIISLSDGVTHDITVKTVWTIYGESTTNISNVVVVNLTSLLEDDFAGTVIDGAKWTVSIEGASNMSLTQNNEIIFEQLGTSNGALGLTNICSIDTFDIATTKVMRFDFETPNTVVSGLWFGLFKANPNAGAVENYMWVGTSGTAGDIRARSNVGGTSQETDLTLDLTTYKSFKIVANATTVSYYYWNGSAWILIDTFTHGMSGTFFSVATARVYGGTIGNQTKFDNLYVTDYDYATLTPS